MTDLRERVEDDRGLLKKIQLFIPGFRGYRQREDARIADSMLRTQVADTVKNTVIQPLEVCREDLSRALELDLMNDMASAVAKAKTVEAKIRHAQQGYSGISAGVRIEQDELDSLYAIDLEVLEEVKALGSSAAQIRDTAAAGAYPELAGMLRQLTAGLQTVSEALDKRVAAAAGILVE